MYAEANPYRGVFMVADGMGGHAAGEVASAMAVQIVTRDIAPLSDITSATAPEAVRDALQDANRAIFDRTISEVDKQGMGTTASVLILSRNRYLIGQVGDSRIYRVRNGLLEQLTKDHSYVQEQVDAGYITPEQARYHPYSNVITRCVGASPEVEPDVYSGELAVGDVFLVASDGLTGMLEDSQLQRLMLAKHSPGRLVDALIGEANRRGGLDNITAVVVQVTAIAGEMTEPTVGAVAELYLGNILYALELAATSLETEGKRDDAGFYRGIARKLAEAKGRELKG